MSGKILDLCNLNTIRGDEKMITYILCFLLSLTIFLVSILTRKFRGVPNISYFIFLLQTILIIFFPNKPDYYNYKFSFDTGIKLYSEQGLAITGDVLKKVGLNDYRFLLIFLMIFIICSFYMWNKISKNIHIAIYLYSLYIMFYDVIQIRNTIACFLILMALYLCIVGAKKRSLLMCFLAFQFHKVAVILAFLVIYILFTSKKSDGKITSKELVFSIIILLTSTFWGYQIIGFLSGKSIYFSRLMYYQSSSLSLDSFIIWAGCQFMLIFLIWTYGIKYLRQVELNEVDFTRVRAVNVLFKFSMLGTSLSGFLLYLNEFNRIYRLLYITSYIIIALLAEYISSKNRRLLISNAIIMNVIFMMVSIFRGLNFDFYW